MYLDSLVLLTAHSSALHGLVPPRRRLLSGGRVDGQTRCLRHVEQAIVISIRIAPCPLDQAPVPGEQGAWRHDPVQPQVPGSSRAKAAITARSAQSGFGRAI